ncbi:hypothetical protein JTB14_021778 [Gonioctena quinquepunctata]|nr:hypothetical protein JTB14_021778 [Gonioctena quinquepunctata]
MTPVACRTPCTVDDFDEEEQGERVLRYDNPCSCCPGCYIQLEEGEECGKDSSTLCISGLKCVNNKCTA